MVEPGLDENITIEQARELKVPAPEVLVPLERNQVIRFGAFKVRDMDTQKDILHVPRKLNEVSDAYVRELEKAGQLQLANRVVKFHFGPQFLRLKAIGLLIEFSVISS